MTETEQLLAQQQPCAEEFQEPYTGNMYDRPYSAMAANPYFNDSVKEHGRLIKTEFAKLFEHPPEALNIPEEFKNILIDNYSINVERRRMINYNNFAKWRQLNPVAEDFIEPAVSRVEQGRAEMGDVLDVGLFTNLTDGLEVGRITHPYGQRIEHVPTMRMHVLSAIHERGGYLEPFDKPYRSIKIEPRLNDEGDIAGFMVRYKRDIGFIQKNEGEVLRIIERQVAAFRADEESGFPAEIITKMEAAQVRENRIAMSDKSVMPFRWIDVKHERFNDLLEDTGCRGFIESAVQADEFTDFIIPDSTTIFCYSEKAPLNYLEVRQRLAKQAIRTPDSDNGIAFFNSNDT